MHWLSYYTVSKYFVTIFLFLFCFYLFCFSFFFYVYYDCNLIVKNRIKKKREVVFLYKYKNKCLSTLKTTFFQGFYSRAAPRRVHEMMWLGPVPPRIKSKRLQILSQVSEGGEGNRGQLPHIRPVPPSPSGLALIDA